MGEQEWVERLRTAAAALGVPLSEDAARQLFRLQELLLLWNLRVNLTAITRPDEVLEKHVLDSLALLPWMPAGRWLDVGAGAGFPGLPLAVAYPALHVTLVDTVGKKVAFMKQAIVALGLVGRVNAVQRRLVSGDELGEFDGAVSRAFAAPEDWVPLGARALRPGGRLLVPVASFPSSDERARLAANSGLHEVGTPSWQLPHSGARRAVWVLERNETPGVRGAG